ncbi:type I-A CRISPR-associated protein Cas7/Csa2 [Candidatus Bathyarchaeota archaeon]|nr:MAG: type I-A CRISPR-associated protein Cas7/Csa2 [Candidatus Bathyarchaeota archaeon]
MKELEKEGEGKMVYLRVSGRAIVNVHTANAEGAVGNYMALSKMFVVRRGEDGNLDVSEEPVISGNMIKHWHAVATTEILKSWGYKAICSNCERHIMFRSVLGKTENLSDEIDFIRKCAIEDLHGFLDVEKQIRRESLVKFSFMIPVEERRAEYSSITHNRVVTTPRGNVPDREEARKLYGVEEAMGVMKREHASGLYGFLCSMDLAYVATSLSDPSKKLSRDNYKVRVKAAILGLTELLSGHFGAAQARALPIVKVTELICLASKTPIPNLAHGFYKDYAEESAGIVKTAVEKGLVKENQIKVLVVGEKPASAFKAKDVSFKEVKTFSEAIGEVLGMIEE